MEDAIDRAAAAIRWGELVVYPTETVYGLGADALDPAAIERVFAAKGRPRDRPLSLAVPDVASAAPLVDVGDVERAFMAAFLPGPVTVLCRRTDRVPDALTAGLDRVGVRVPDHPMALSLLREVAPITATSANRSGRGDVTHPSDLDAELRAAVSVVLDGGRTPGGPSTVVDPARGEIVRRGTIAAEVEAWLADRGVAG